MPLLAFRLPLFPFERGILAVLFLALYITPFSPGSAVTSINLVSGIAAADDDDDDDANDDANDDVSLGVLAAISINTTQN